MFGENWPWTCDYAPLPHAVQSGHMASTTSSPNLLLILTDQQRSDSLGVTGSPASTPALDGLAAEGTVFDNAVTNSPVCMPARVSLAAGLYPHQLGYWDNGPYAWPEGQRSWMAAVRDVGYHTGYFGKGHLGRSTAEVRGIDRAEWVQGPRQIAISDNAVKRRWEAAGFLEAYKKDLASRSMNNPEVRPTPVPLELYYDVLVPDFAIEHLRALPAAEPWMCVVSFPGPHAPWDTPSPYNTMFDPQLFPAAAEPIHLPDGVKTHLDVLLHQRFAPMSDELVAAMRADYAGSIRLIDDKIGDILDVVKERGEWDNTVIAFSSDHGEMNGDHGMIGKATFLNEATRVPLIVRDPSCSAGRSEALVELMDVGATLCDYAGAQPPATSVARSLRPILSNQGTPHRDVVVSQIRGETMVMNARYKLMVNTRGEDVFLTDQLEDPAESTNLLIEGGAADVVAHMRDQLLRFHMTNRHRATSR